MKYDFSSIIDRHGRDALAVDALGSGWAPDAPKEGFDALPLTRVKEAFDRMDRYVFDKE